MLPLFTTPPFTRLSLSLLLFPPFIITPYSFYSPFSRIVLRLISPAECTSQHMCINRPSGGVLANKDPVCVRKRGAPATNVCAAASSPCTQTERGFISGSGGSLCGGVDNEAARPGSFWCISHVFSPCSSQRPRVWRTCFSSN